MLKDFSQTITVAALAQKLGCPFEGEGATILKGVSSLEEAEEGDLVFFSEKKHRDLLEKTKASAVILPPDVPFPRMPVLRSEKPYLTFVKALDFFYKPFLPEPGIHSQALVSPSAQIGRHVSIGAFAYIGDEAVIGDGSAIFPLVTIYPKASVGKNCLIHSQVSLREGVRIGNRVILHSGVVVGSDGFGYIQSDERSYIKVPQKGSVIIEDDVEVGANTTIDRATLSNTIIRKGTKIDNLVMIAHNVEIGEDGILAGQTGVAGSTKIGKNFIAGGQVGIADHLTIGDNVIMAAKTGVTKDVVSGSFVSGSPHLDIRSWRKAWASIPQLFDLIREVRKLRKRVEELEKQIR
ncbi:MAG: UDP-3-O-(3-hydroxymyristoyl)glucosamine N-acyltransferase [Candidatus Aminicenantes bacterium]|nr:UDP-3-O-(3-hydroxymyristoyl)glucosamine N-acyltransferase [Candidatus Aminicenantes bacterium]